MGSPLTADGEILHVDILPQPDDTTCGPTCLHAAYRYYGDIISLTQVIREVRKLKGGGTLAVFLACHALKRGYQAKIYTYNLHVFDPTWFIEGQAGGRYRQSPAGPGQGEKYRQAQNRHRRIS